MTLAAVAPNRSELAEMTPAEFVGLIRSECSVRGMHNHPIVQEMEAGTASVQQLQLFTEQYYLHVSRMLP